MRKSYLIPALLASFALQAHSQQTTSVRPLETMLGYKLGERITDDAALQSFLAELARTSPRVKLFEYGRTHEGRPLQYLVITSEANHAKLDQIREGLQRLGDPRRTSQQEAEQLASSLPVAVWLAYSVHGNEHSGTEAGIQIAHRLAAASDAETLEWLESAVVLLDPCENPDGRARFVAHFRSNMFRDPNPDPHALEHGPAWGSPRYNHYFFDLNRDWFILSQPEALGRAQAFLQWPGQVYGDFHEMDGSSSYFFFPPTEAIHSVFGAETRALWESFGKALAEAFDAQKLPYYTAEYFDAFYPGYGDTWPSLQGAVGMTFEQASARGLVTRRADKTLLHYSDSIRGHATASEATLRHAVARRRDLLLYTYGFHERAMADELPGLPRQIFLPSGQDPLRLESLLHVLRAQGIEFSRLTEKLSLRSAYGPLGGAPAAAEVGAGAVYISTLQPKRRLLQVLFEREAKLSEEFLKAEREKLLRGEYSGFYDITAWSVPLALGLDAVYSDEEVLPKSEPVIFPAPEADALLDPEPYAALVPWSGRAPRVLYELARLELPLRVATREFRLGGKDYAAGTVVVLGQRSPGLGKALESLEPEARREIVTTMSGSTEIGPDLGSETVVPLRAPRIALIGDRPTDEASFGALAYLFDIRYRIPFTALRLESLGQADLSEYDVILLPDGGDEDYRAGLGGVKKELEGWIRAGGVLIAIGGASEALASEELGLTEVRLVKADEEKKEAEPTDAEANEPKAAGSDPNAPAEEAPPGSVGRPEWPIGTPGALLLAQVDTRNYLGFGLPRELPVLWTGARAFAADAKRLDPIRLALSADKLRLSGHLWPEAAEKLKGTPYLVDVSLGRGHVILFIEDPSFRALLWQVQRLLLNAVLLAPSQ